MNNSNILSFPFMNLPELTRVNYWYVSIQMYSFRLSYLHELLDSCPFLLVFYVYGSCKVKFPRPPPPPVGYLPIVIVIALCLGHLTDSQKRTHLSWSGCSTCPTPRTERCRPNTPAPAASPSSCALWTSWRWWISWRPSSWCGPDADAAPDPRWSSLRLQWAPKRAMRSRRESEHDQRSRSRYSKRRIPAFTVPDLCSHQIPPRRIATTLETLNSRMHASCGAACVCREARACE